MKTNKDCSPLVQAVLQLDEHFQNLERLSQKIGELKLKNDTEFEVARRLMAHFAEHGEGVATQVVALSRELQEARTRAEAAAEIVTAKTEILQSRRNNVGEKAEAFRALTEKVAKLGQELASLKKPEGQSMSEAEREQMLERLADFGQQLRPLIEESKMLQQQAREAKMRELDQQAQSLTLNLLNVEKQVSALL